MHDPVTLVGHNAGVTLFDVSDLFGAEPPPAGASDGPSGAPASPDSPDVQEPPVLAEPAEPPAPLREVGTIERAPEVEVRISKRRKKTSEAKWVGGRIVVSLPSHLDVESRQKTIDWLVERLLTRQQLQSG